MIRTFLETRMVHIPRLGYVQYQDGGNTQRVRNKDIQRHVRGRLAPYEYPREIQFIAELPMTMTGKLKRRELRERL